METTHTSSLVTDGTSTHPPRTDLDRGETDAIDLLAAGGITAELVWEGPSATCPWPAHHEEVPSAA